MEQFCPVLLNVVLFLCSFIHKINFWSYLKGKKKKMEGFVSARFLIGRIIAVNLLVGYSTTKIRISFLHENMLCSAFSGLVWGLSVKESELRSQNDLKSRRYHLKRKNTFRCFSSCNGVILKYRIISKCIQKNALLILNTFFLQKILNKSLQIHLRFEIWVLTLISTVVCHRVEFFHSIHLGFVMTKKT